MPAVIVSSQSFLGKDGRLMLFVRLGVHKYPTQLL